MKDITGSIGVESCCFFPMSFMSDIIKSRPVYHSKVEELIS